MPKSILIFTAGKGTRMSPLSDTMPKPMIPVNGAPLAQNAYNLASEQNLHTVMNLHYLPDSIANHFGPLGVEFSNEASDLLETGGGLRKALPLMHSNPVFTLNSDVVWSGPNPLSLLHDAWDSNSMDALLMLIPTSRTHGHTGSGDFSLGDQGIITRGGNLTYTGTQIIITDRLNQISKTAFSLNEYWDLLMENDRVFGTVYPGEWCDVGQPASIPIAEKLLSRAVND